MERTLRCDRYTKDPDYLGCVGLQGLELANWLFSGESREEPGLVSVGGSDHTSSEQSSRRELSEWLRAECQAVGFDYCGIAPAVQPTGLHEFYRWLEDGHHGEMDYLARRKEAYQHPSGVLPNCRSVVSLALNYNSTQPMPTASGRGRISRYAWGDVDYHDWIHKRLKQIVRSARERFEQVQLRAVVDTAPLLERDFARLAGLGWQGKNTMLIRRDMGSWFFLAFLLADCELDYDPPDQSDFCGSCSACLQACPTDAFVTAHQLDARRCISYLTIEQRGLPQRDLRESIGEWLFGCDVCQDVCPWNRFAKPTRHAEFHPHGKGDLDLVELLSITDDQFRVRFRKTPLWRSKRAGIVRNAAIVLGNQRPSRALVPLIKALDDNEPVVRGSVAWALGKYDEQAAGDALQKRRAIETEASVVEEIELALAERFPSGGKSPQ